jgi:hypothetical protein
MLLHKIEPGYFENARVATHPEGGGSVAAFATLWLRQLLHSDSSTSHQRLLSLPETVREGVDNRRAPRVGLEIISPVFISQLASASQKYR